jgi:Holliday junction resolvase RusA-like endonuclease
MVRLYTPPKTVAYESLIAAQAYQAMKGAPPIDGPVVLDLDLVHVMPASWSKKKRAAMPVPQCKPDVDNVLKAVGDGGNGVLWMDDKQIAQVTARRVWGERPEVRVRVAAIGVGE